MLVPPPCNAPGLSVFINLYFLNEILCFEFNLVSLIRTMSGSCVLINFSKLYLLQLVMIELTLTAIIFNSLSSTPILVLSY